MTAGAGNGGAGDGLFGLDGTGGDVIGSAPPDGVGPLPGLDLPAVRLPVIGADGTISGLDDFDADLGLDADPTVAATHLAERPGLVKIDDSVPATPPPAVVASEPPILPLRPDRLAPRPARHAPGWADHPGAGRAGPPVVPRPGPPPRSTGANAARPRIVDEPAILGLSRRTRSRLGSRLFTAFFVLVFAVIVIQLVVALLQP